MLMSIVLVSQLFDGSQRCYPLPTVATIRHYALEIILQLDLVDKTAPHTPNGLDHTAFVGAACHILFVFVGDTCDNMRLLHSAKKPAKTSWQGFIFCEAVTFGYYIIFTLWRNAKPRAFKRFELWLQEVLAFVLGHMWAGQRSNIGLSVSEPAR